MSLYFSLTSDSIPIQIVTICGIGTRIRRGRAGGQRKGSVERMARGRKGVGNEIDIYMLLFASSDFLNFLALYNVSLSLTIGFFNKKKGESGHIAKH